VVINNKNKTDLFEISRRVINNNVCYVCCVDKQGELLHDIIDEDIVIREVEVENNYLPFNIITTWHSDIENTIWYAIYTAHNEAMNIDTIFCLDAGENDSKEELDNLIKRFTQGYIPPGN